LKMQKTTVKNLLITFENGYFYWFSQILTHFRDASRKYITGLDVSIFSDVISFVSMRLAYSAVTWLMTSRLTTSYLTTSRLQHYFHLVQNLTWHNNFSRKRCNKFASCDRSFLFCDL
jgi:hypothetical protein